MVAIKQEQDQHGQNTHHNKKHSTKTSMKKKQRRNNNNNNMAADASFLAEHANSAMMGGGAAIMAASHMMVDDSAAAESSESTSHARERLLRMNVMRMESEQLLSESSRHAQVGGEEHSATATGVDVVKWSKEASVYVQAVQEVIKGMKPTVLDPSLAEYFPSQGEKQAKKQQGKRQRPSADEATTPTEGNGCWVKLQSDMYHRHKQDTGSEKPFKWEIAFPGGSSLHTAVVGSARRPNAGLLHKSANAHVLPVVDLAVLIPPPQQESPKKKKDEKKKKKKKRKKDEDEEGKQIREGAGEESMLMPQDYFNHRYFDKRNLLALHLARTFTQKKHSSTIGTVQLSYHRGDLRRLVLLLTPPPSKTNHHHHHHHHHNKNKKSKFQVRLLIGTKGLVFGKTRYLPHVNNCPRYFTSLGKEQEGREERELEKNRYTTPHYNNALAEDGMYLDTSHLYSTWKTSRGASSSSSSATIATSCSTYHGALVFVKLWLAQRGHLYPHDTLGSVGASALLTYLFAVKKVSEGMSPWHVFGAWLKFLAETDFTGDASMGATTTRRKHFQEDREAEGKVLVHAGSIGYQGQGSLFLHRCATFLGEECAWRQRTVLMVPSPPSSSFGAEGPFVLPELDIAHSETSVLQLHQSHGSDAVLLHPLGWCNYLAHCSVSAMKEVRLEAQASLPLVHGSTGGGSRGSGGGAWREAFDELFLTSQRFWTRHDVYLHVPLSHLPFVKRSAGKKKEEEDQDQEEEEWGQALTPHWLSRVADVGAYEAYSRTAVELVSAALGNRALLVRPLTCGNGALFKEEAGGGSRVVAPLGVNAKEQEEGLDANQVVAWPCRGCSKEDLRLPPLRGMACPLSWSNMRNEGEEEEKGENGPCLVLGIRIDAEHAARLVDRGPPADERTSLSAKEFRAFWGPKAELRRFKDGAIVYAVVWNRLSTNTNSTPLSFASDEASCGIVERIVRYILQHHLLDDGSTNNTNQSKKTNTMRFCHGQVLNLIENIHHPSTSSTTLVDGCTQKSWVDLHKEILQTFHQFSSWLLQRTKSSDDAENRLGGIPMGIDAVEPLSPALRYAELFPPVKHALLLHSSSTMAGTGVSKVAGAICTHPIMVQLRLGASNKWPSDVNAIQAAKCAFLLRLAEGMEKELYPHGAGKRPIAVRATFMDVPYGGYVFRVFIRPEEELQCLRHLKNMTEAAKELQEDLRRNHVVAATHHTTIHAVHTRHISAAGTVRLAVRWLSSHMVDRGMVPIEVVELLVAKVYSSGAHQPGSVMAGFLRLLELLGGHDWVSEPLIVDPQQHLTDTDHAQIHAAFDAIRGPARNNGPPMFLISPHDKLPKDPKNPGAVANNYNINASSNTSNNSKNEKTASDNGGWMPTYARQHPERVVLSRISALARRCHEFLLRQMIATRSINDDQANTSTATGMAFAAAFQESSSSLASFTALLRVHPKLLVDKGCSSTEGEFEVQRTVGGNDNDEEKKKKIIKKIKKDMRNDLLIWTSPFGRSMKKRYLGPVELRRRAYKNLNQGGNGILYEWQPTQQTVDALRSNLGHVALFLYNDLSPDVIAMTLRPQARTSQPLSALHSAFKRPVGVDEVKTTSPKGQMMWTRDSLLQINLQDVMAEMQGICKDLVVDMKILETQSSSRGGATLRKRKHQVLTVKKEEPRLQQDGGEEGGAADVEIAGFHHSREVGNDVDDKDDSDNDTDNSDDDSDNGSDDESEDGIDANKSVPSSDDNEISQSDSDDTSSNESTSEDDDAQ